MKKLLFLLLFFITTGTLSLHSQDADAALTAELNELFTAAQLPGLAVAVVNAEGTLYRQAFGTGFSSDQRHYVASISKTFIGLALMQLVEAGQLELSTPVNNVLPFQVTNPYHPGVAITVEHLARHTSGIRYEGLEVASWFLDAGARIDKKSFSKEAYRDFTAWSKNTPQELGTFLRDCLTNDGAHYSRKRFSRKRPGAEYAYSNLGAALAAYLVELKTGEDFATYVEKLLQEKFAFPPQVWRGPQHADLPMAYFQDGILVPNYHPILYPAGGMLLSCDELSAYLTEIIRGLQGKSDLLTPASFATMLTKGTTGNGIFWEINGNRAGHNGGNYGTTALMSFDKATGIGKILLTNISSYQDESKLRQIVKVWQKLDEY
ncbi:MAG: serine hydrolase domain-containing protein [Bacteroidota bacterium]